MRPRNFYVYILASGVGGTLYIGVTNNLIRRVAEHRLKLLESFTEKYDVVRLVYFEQFDDAENAIKREKRLKKWNRAWKISHDRGEQPELGRPVPRHSWAAIVFVIPRAGGASSTPQRL